MTTAFMTNLACEILRNLPERENIAFSPLGISSCLAIIYTASDGDTLREIANTLQIPTSSEVDQIFDEILKHFDGKKKKNTCRVRIVNGVFCCKNSSLQQGFMSTLNEHYQSSVQSVNFGKGKSVAKKINKWAEDETNGKIKKLITENFLHPLSKLIMVNTLYFKGIWREKFFRKCTEKMTFRIDTSKTCQVDMMKQETDLWYYENDQYQVVSIPYMPHQINLERTSGICPAISMNIVLPRQVDGIFSLTKQLTTSDINAWIGNMTLQKILLRLPRFSITHCITLSILLKNLGIKSVFEISKANFSKMSQDADVFLSEVFHHVAVEVNEEGTEAAATTVANTVNCSLSESINPVEVIVDHPFIFMIYDETVNCILFMGKIFSPSL